MRVVETVPSNMPAPSTNVTLSPSMNAVTAQSTHAQVANLTQQETKESANNTLTTITSNEQQSKCSH